MFCRNTINIQCNTNTQIILNLPISFVILSKKALSLRGPSASMVQSLTILKHLKYDMQRGCLYYLMVVMIMRGLRVGGMTIHVKLNMFHNIEGRLEEVR